MYEEDIVNIDEDIYLFFWIFMSWVSNKEISSSIHSFKYPLQYLFSNGFLLLSPVFFSYIFLSFIC